MPAHTWSLPGVTDGPVDPLVQTPHHIYSFSPAVTSTGEPVTAFHVVMLPAVLIVIEPPAMVVAVKTTTSPEDMPEGRATAVAPVVPDALALAARKAGRAMVYLSLGDRIGDGSSCKRQRVSGA